PIGKGAFATVYSAFQHVVNREVAIKVIRPEFANKPDFIHRFEIEAHLVASLEHSHIVPPYDFWREPNGAFLVLGRLKQSLRSALNDGPWSPQEVDRLVDQIAGALTIAHRRGVVHRDLKPENIMLDEDCNAYLADFGIAKQLEVNREAGNDNTLSG